MDYSNMKVVDLKALAIERGLKGYSKLKKAELITFLQNNLRPTPAPRTRPPKPTRPLTHLHKCLLGNLYMIDYLRLGLDQIGQDS